jgi:hypothetical protein
MKTYNAKCIATKEELPVTESQLYDVVSKRAEDINRRLISDKIFSAYLVVVRKRWDLWLVPMTDHIFATITVTEGDTTDMIVEKLVYALEGKEINSRAWFVFNNRAGILSVTTNLEFERQPGNIFRVKNFYGMEGRFNSNSKDAPRRVRVISSSQAVQIAEQMAKVCEIQRALREAADVLQSMKLQSFGSGRPVTNADLYQMLLDQESKADG